MLFLQLIILSVNLITTVFSAYKNVNCPGFCKCDSYQQLNRAQCSSKYLISAEMVLSNQVQILDLSYNDITILDSNCFGNFLHLKYLNLSHNAVHSIEWNTFFSLLRLTEINLSYNRLEYLDERLFYKNNNLNKVNLAGNKFQTLENKPLLRNPFVKTLILQHSQISFLQPQLFAGLSSLKSLDLSENLLNNFNIEDFNYLEDLQELNLNDNFIKCNKDISNKLEQLKNRGINVTFKECKLQTRAKPQQQGQKFEKLIMADRTVKETNNQKELSNINQWHLYIDEEMSDDDDNAEREFNDQEISTSHRNNNELLPFVPAAVLCNQEYRTCLQDLSKAWLKEQQCREQYPLNDIKFAFVLGIAIGVAAIVFILVCALCLKRCLEVKKFAPTIIGNIDDLPNQPLARPTSQLPPQVRRMPRRRAALTGRSLVRYEGPVTENFLSRLFGRPARQQYYRSINQNTATLIRRLSRSNLFNNRLSQHFTERESSADANSPEMHDYPPTAPRPETPPPAYGDVIVKNMNARS